MHLSVNIIHACKTCGFLPTTVCLGVVAFITSNVKQKMLAYVTRIALVDSW